MASLSNLYSVIDGLCALKVDNNCYTENTFYIKQAEVSKIDKQLERLVYYQFELNRYSSDSIHIVINKMTKNIFHNVFIFINGTSGELRKLIHFIV